MKVWQRYKAIAEIGNLAQANGYDKDQTIGRLEYGSFVSRHRKYVFLETPKVACTAFKQMIVKLEGVPFDLSLRPYMLEKRIDLLIHQRDYIDIPSIVDMSGDERRHVFGGSNDWFVFAVVRNPFSRLVSAFENKVYLRDPKFHQYLGACGKPDGAQDSLAQFRSFVRDVATNKVLSENPHIAAQRKLLMPELIKYTGIYKIESVREALAAFNAHLRRVGVEEDVRLPRHNASPIGSWRVFYDDEISEMVSDIYRDDFSMFGYDPLDWRPSPGAVRRQETDAERFWRDEVIARNEMIEHLYGLMDRYMGAPRRARRRWFDS